MKYANIGFYDSGVGGLAYLEHFIHKYNDIEKTSVLVQKCMYIADNKCFPYGDKSEKFLTDRITSLALKFVETFDISILILACNTATLLTMDILKKILAEKSVDIVGTVPAIKPAVKLQAKRVYVMSTIATSNSRYVKEMASNTKEKYGYESKIFLRPCQDLVEAIELMLRKGAEHNEAYVISLLEKIVDEVISLDCEAVVLGCTHFLHIKKQLKALLASSISIVDSLDGVANRILDLLPQVSSKETKEGAIDLKNRFYCTKIDEDNYFRKLSQDYNLEFMGLFHD